MLPLFKSYEVKKLHVLKVISSVNKTSKVWQFLGLERD